MDKTEVSAFKIVADRLVTDRRATVARADGLFRKPMIGLDDGGFACIGLSRDSFGCAGKIRGVITARFPHNAGHSGKRLLPDPGTGEGVVDELGSRDHRNHPQRLLPGFTARQADSIRDMVVSGRVVASGP